MAEADKPQRMRALTQLSLQNKNYPKALQVGAEYMSSTRAMRISRWRWRRHAT